MAISTSIGLGDEEGGIFGLPTVSALKESDSTTTGGDGVSDVTQLPTMVVNEKPVEPTGTFTPGQLTQAPTLTGAVPAITPGGPVVSGGPNKIDVKTKWGTYITSEELQQIIQARLALLEKERGRPLTEEQRKVAVDDVFYEIWGSIPFGSPNRPRTNQQGGLPLVVPIPGLDPATALAVTAAGLIFSGGNIATLKPEDPIGSVVDAVKGVGQTGQNVINVATGEDTLGNIWSGSSGGSGGTSGSGAAGTAGAGQQTSGTGSLILVGAGGQPVSGGQTGPFVGPVAASQQQAGGGTVTVTPGALGGAETGTPNQLTIVGGGQTGPFVGPVASQEQSNTKVPGITSGGGDQVGKQGVIGVAPVQIATAEKTLPAQTTGVTGTGDQVGKIGTTPGVISTGTGINEKESPSQTPAVISTGPTKTTGGTTSGATATTVIPVPTSFTFTKTTPGEVAMRDFEKEFGLTSSTLMGQAGQDLAKYYQQLQAQFTPSTLTALAGTSEQQLQNDIARYQAAMQGQLSPEDIRSAQQGAREAYAARGQVFSPGAIGAEILGRDQLMRQRQAEARQNLQQSMGNVGAAAQLQTGNIFAPFANLLAKTYGPTNEYANAVYDYNVNAYNAYQAAQENLAAYKEAAAKGQEAQFIATFANFLANNGIQTTQNALSKFFQALLPKG